MLSKEIRERQKILGDIVKSKEFWEFEKGWGKMNKEYIKGKISEFANKYELSEEQAVRILYNVNEIKGIWQIQGLDEYLMEYNTKVTKNDKV